MHMRRDIGGDTHFLYVMNKGASFASCAQAFEVPCWSLVYICWTSDKKKLPMSLSRLNDINEGCEKKSTSFGIISKQFKVLRLMDSTAWLWWWNVRVNGIRSVFFSCDVCDAVYQFNYAVVARLSDRNRIATFFEKLAHCLWLVGKISVVTT